MPGRRKKKIRRTAIWKMPEPSGDTVGDPFKDTSSVARNPFINFTTLFGLLAVEIAVELKQKHPDSIASCVIGGTCFLVALVFDCRSFYCMRIPVEKPAGP
jgi:K(+)-stimulated pyrophosphate-energized sodium pump